MNRIPDETPAEGLSYLLQLIRDSPPLKVALTFASGLRVVIHLPEKEELTDEE